MKRINIALLSGALLALPSACAQPAQQRPQPTPASTQNAAPRNPDLVKFDLNFPGGTPRQLVEAIEKTSGRTLNAIVPDELASLHLPELKMKAVTVHELFQALHEASVKTVPHLYIDGRLEYENFEYGFKTAEPPVAISDNSIWYFYSQKPLVLQYPKTCRFYQLTPYLETCKVEDITTAIQTGWKMLGETNQPTISFHKDTKLLIAVGEEAKLRLIDSVLSQLSMGKPAAQRESTAAKSTTAKQ
jgi:hypothetical protein